LARGVVGTEFPACSTQASGMYTLLTGNPIVKNTVQNIPGGGCDHDSASLPPVCPTSQPRPATMPYGDVQLAQDGSATEWMMPSAAHCSMRPQNPENRPFGFGHGPAL